VRVFFAQATEKASHAHESSAVLILPLLLLAVPALLLRSSIKSPEHMNALDRVVVRLTAPLQAALVALVQLTATHTASGRSPAISSLSSDEVPVELHVMATSNLERRTRGARIVRRLGCLLPVP